MSRFLLTITVILLVCCLPIVAEGKGWRGIVPLRSTRADVERLLGPGNRGHYQFDEERAHVNYLEGECNPVNGCLCLVPKDTVISIYVQLEVEMRFSKLNIDKKKYEKTVSPEDPTVATYANDKEGIIYTVNEENDDVIAIEYIPTAKDCKDVERILGLPSKEAAHYAAYNFENESVMIWYATAACGGENSSGWNVPRGTVVEVTLRPTKVMKLAELHLDLGKFKREVNDHFPDESFYENAKEGFGVVTIRGNVSALRYYPSESQNHLRCNADDKQKKRRESSPTELTSEQKAMIDQLMTRLDQEPDLTGWIRIDTARRHAGDPDLADMVFRFVKEKYSSKIKRISIMAGAFSQNQEIEFFIISPDGKPMAFRP